MPFRGSVDVQWQHTGKLFLRRRLYVIRILWAKRVFSHLNSPPVDTAVWWWRNESAGCQKTAQKVRISLNGHRDDRADRPSTSRMTVSVAQVEELSKKKNRLEAIRNLVTAFHSNKWKLLFVNGCKFDSAVCNGNGIFNLVSRWTKQSMCYKITVKNQTT